MIGCYYCVDYDAETNTCALYGDLVDNCDSFLFDTGIDDPESIECAELGSTESQQLRMEGE